MLSKENNQLDNTDIDQKIDNKSNTIINNVESVDDWFNTLHVPDVDNTNYNLIGDKVRQGLEVGVSELNSLADLFEGETPDLNPSLEEKEILDQGKLEVDDHLKVSVIDIDIDDSNDLYDLLFDINEEEKLSEINNKSEGNFVNLVDDDLSDLFNKTEKNELVQESKYQTKNTNLQQEESSNTKSKDNLYGLFSELNNGDLMELEAGNPQVPSKLYSQNEAEQFLLDELDFSDLLLIQDLEKEENRDIKAAKSELNTNAKNDLTSKAANLEALFEDLEAIDEQVDLEEIQVEAENLTSSFAELFTQEDLNSSDSQELMNLDVLDYQDLTQENNNDLNSLLENQSLDFSNLDSNELLENTFENNDTTEENNEFSADLEYLWTTVEEPKANNRVNKAADETIDLDNVLDVESETTSEYTEKSQQLIANNHAKVDDYEFIALEAILNGEKLENYDALVQLEKLLTGMDVKSQRQVNTVVVDNTNTKEVSVSTKNNLQLAEDPFKVLDELLENSHPETSNKASFVSTSNPARSRGKRSPEQTIKVPAKQLDNLSNLVGELIVNRNSLEQSQERMRQFLDNLLHQVILLSDAGQRMHDLYEKTLLERAIWDSRHRNHSNNTIHISDTRNESNAEIRDLKDPLDLDRVENFTPFHLLAQETIEYIVRVRESASDIEFLVDDAEQVTRQLRQVTTQLQEGFTKSRMVPFSETVQPLFRVVRDNSIRCGKEIELHVEGKETLIDKMIQVKLSDPMIHLMNNAITHGIETPQERLSRGKFSKGRITIRAFHQGNQTVISVADDGAGINPEKVKNKAIKKDLMTEKQAQEISSLDVYDLLFHPGFSTKDKITDIAGRGVGLDVVKTNLNDIRGTITIDSTIGKGTIFTIRLPLTLSISKALCCLSDRSWIAFPMDGVEDMLKVSKGEIKIGAQGQNYIEWRGAKLPFRHLRELLVYNHHVRRSNVYGINTEEDMISIVVLRSASAGIFLAVQVDQVLEQQKEIVIKQLQGPVPKPLGIAGATVLGDGKIVAIADVIELINLATGRQRRDEGNVWLPGDGNSRPLPTEQSVPTVLIVDDSITVRELLSMTFSKAGYRVEQARDGKDAWEKLRAGLPCDLVFCDIEMPRMDGFELLSRMQKDSNLQSLPIAMLTSRGAKKHMEMAFELGAKGYFTKPYIEDKLLDGAVSILEGKTIGDVVHA